MFKKITTVTLLWVIMLILPGCVSIPPEAPELSVELGKRISTIENANITLLKRFFDQKRDEVDKFIENEWTPEFANQFFTDRKIANAWDIIVRENDKQQRLLFLTKTGPRLQKKINEKRLELIRPLDELERRIEAKIRQEYAQARALNNSITSFLLSAAKVTESRNRYLDRVGAADSNLAKWVDETDEAVSELIGRANEVDDRATRAGRYLRILREIRESI